MSEIKVYRVPQYMSKRVNVICVDGIPVCTARGKKTTSDIVAKLSGYDVEIKDGRINKLKGERLSKSLCSSCMHNCTNRKSGSSANYKGIWCNAEYGRTVFKKVKECKNYITEERNE